VSSSARVMSRFRPKGTFFSSGDYNISSQKTPSAAYFAMHLRCKSLSLLGSSGGRSGIGLAIRSRMRKAVTLNHVGILTMSLALRMTFQIRLVSHLAARDRKIPTPGMCNLPRLLYQTLRLDEVWACVRISFGRLLSCLAAMLQHGALLP